MYKFLFNLLNGMLMHIVALSWTDDTTPRTTDRVEFHFQRMTWKVNDYKTFTWRLRSEHEM